MPDILSNLLQFFFSICLPIKCLKYCQNSEVITVSNFLFTDRVTQDFYNTPFTKKKEQIMCKVNIHKCSVHFTSISNTIELLTERWSLIVLWNVYSVADVINRFTDSAALGVRSKSNVRIFSIIYS